MAHIIGSNVAIITVKGIMQNEFTYSSMEYYPSVGDGDESASDVNNGWEDEIKDLWLALASEDWEMLEINCSHKIDGIYTDASKAINEVGLVLGDALPVYNTFSFVKVPDNANRDPDDERTVGKGRIAFSGVAELDVADGKIKTAARVNADALAAAISTFQPLVGTSTFLMYIQSLATVADPVEVFAPVQYVLYNRMGTQLTRKS